MRYRFLRRRRWLALLAAAAVVVVVCVAAGLWQLRRHTESAERTALARARAAMPEAEGLPDGDASWRAVRVRGRYDPAHEVVLIGRSLDGRPGNNVLTPLRTPEGAVLVNRGWVPSEEADAAVPRGVVEVRGVLVPAELRERVDGDLPPRLVRVDTGRVAGALPYPLRTDTYLVLREQDPPQDGLPLAADVPPPSRGTPHLAYAGQWFFFAAIAIGGVAALARREAAQGGRSPEPVLDR